jgi:hypothetical protein
MYMKYPSLKHMKSHVTWVVLVPLTLVSCFQHTCKPTKVTTIQYPKPLPRVATNSPMCLQFSHQDLLGLTDVCFNDASLQATQKSLKGSFLWHASLKQRSVNSCLQSHSTSFLQNILSMNILFHRRKAVHVLSLGPFMFIQ